MFYIQWYRSALTQLKHIFQAAKKRGDEKTLLNFEIDDANKNEIFHRAVDIY